MKVLTLAGRAFAVGHSMARTDVIAPQARCAVVVPLRIYPSGPVDILWQGHIFEHNPHAVHELVWWNLLESIRNRQNHGYITVVLNHGRDPRSRSVRKSLSDSHSAIVSMRWPEALSFCDAISGLSTLKNGRHTYVLGICTEYIPPGTPPHDRISLCHWRSMLPVSSPQVHTMWQRMPFRSISLIRLTTTGGIPQA